MLLTASTALAFTRDPAAVFFNEPFITITALAALFCKRPMNSAAAEGSESGGGQAAAAVREEVAQAHGSRSSMRLIGWSAMRARTSRR